MIRRLLIVLVSLGVLATLALSELQRRWQQPLLLPEGGVEITVARGESLRAVLRRLHNEGIVAYPDVIAWYGRYSGEDQNIKHGEYRLSAGSTHQGLLALLVGGEVVQHQVTFPEGITLRQALFILAEQERLQATLSGPDDPRILEITAPHASPEGLFFPDSYHFSTGDTDWQVLQRAHTAMQTVLRQEWEDRSSELPYDTPYEALIMASIIERETGLPEEREQIAGVFVRRLQQGMLLQTDPTIIYGLGAEFDGNLRRSHLRDSNNPYNTYRHKGLPPSPIALAGRAAIHAALHPSAGQELFFVARGDGGHVFSRTLAEHEEAVRKYQLRRRSDYRSSPEKR